MKLNEKTMKCDLLPGNDDDADSLSAANGDGAADDDRFSFDLAFSVILFCFKNEVQLQHNTISYFDYSYFVSCHTTNLNKNYLKNLFVSCYITLLQQRTLLNKMQFCVFQEQKKN